MRTFRSVGLVNSADLQQSSTRELPAETPVALSFNGSAQAVMMATPADLEDFAYGFALTEGIARPEDLLEVSIVEGTRGIDVQTWLADGAGARLAARRRTMAGPVGCGLCGIDSISEALRELPPVTARDLRVSPEAITEAIEALPDHQPLRRRTRATHCAAWWVPGQGITAAREDVGRHNALDKLAGHLVRSRAPAGVVLLTSRVSIDLVQKVAALQGQMLVAVSAPTADAVALADQLGVTLVALARKGSFEVFTHPFRLSPAPGAGV